MFWVYSSRSRFWSPYQWKDWNLQVAKENVEDASQVRGLNIGMALAAVPESGN